MITTIIISSLVLNLVLGLMVYSLSKEKPSNKTKTIHKEKIVYKDKPVVHEFVKKEEPKVSPQRQELLDVLTELKSKKKKSKKDMENIYTIEKVLPNIK